MVEFEKYENPKKQKLAKKIAKRIWKCHRNQGGIGLSQPFLDFRKKSI